LKKQETLIRKGLIMAHTFFNINNNSSMLSVGAYRVVTFIERISQSMAKAKDRRQTFKTLHALTDRELNDIGISRGDIRSIANDTWEDNRKRDTLPYTPVNPNLRGSV
jgi:uncharacterized protein YjiS (DUF1127 family)